MLTFDTVFSKSNLAEAFQKASAKDHYRQDDMEAIKAFTLNLALELDRLAFELKNQTYEPAPMKAFQHKKEITLIPFRDRIVHECIQKELKSIVAGNAVKGNFGYLEGKSTFQAADFIHSMVQYHGISYFLSTDINSFFPSISHSLLADKLTPIIDDTLLGILRKLISAPLIKTGSELIYPTRGIILGSPLSPTLSNLFLQETDLALEAEYPMFVRYSDDLLLGSTTPFTAFDLEKIKTCFAGLELEMNEEKTHFYSLKDSFIFLGFEFNFTNLQKTCVKDECCKDGGMTETEQLEHFKNVMNAENTVEAVLRYLQYAATTSAFNESMVDITFCTSILNADSKYLFSVLSEISLPNEPVPVSFPYDEVISICLNDEQWNLAYLLQSINMKKEAGSLENYCNLSPCKLPKNYLNLFCGRKNEFAKGYADIHGTRHYYKINLPLTLVDVQKMLEERQSLGVYPVTGEGESCVFVIDLDIAKQFLLEHSGKDELMANMLNRVKNLAFNIKGTLDEAGLHSYILFSGYKGYHVWILFDTSVSVVETWNYLNAFIQQVFIPDNIVLERLPSLEADPDEVIKLPLSWHELTHRQSVFLNASGEADADQSAFIDGMQKNSSFSSSIKAIPATSAPKLISETKEEVPPTVEALIQHCKLIRFIMERVNVTGYLTHYERNALLYVLGHMGEVGRKYLHKLLAQCINYQFEVTEGFISRIKDKPVSCQKLMLRFPQYVDACSCQFTDCPHFYPSPVIHAYRVDAENVTRPDYIDREARDKEIKTVSEQAKLNILSDKLLSLAKSKNEIERDLEICTKTVEDIFNELGITQIKTAAGQLMIKDGCWYIKVT